MPAFPSSIRSLASATVLLTLAACGGSGQTPATSAVDAFSSASSSTPASAPPVILSTILRALPASVADGDSVQLECGQTYGGTLNLEGRANVTVTTAGDCGNATITPARPVSGWSAYQGSIYSAPIGFDAAQVIADGQALSRAHWPSRAQTWASANASSSTSLSYPMPNGDLAGATLLFRSAEWFIGARTVTGYAGGVMTLAATGNPSFDDFPLSGTPQFYVEGKLWMLDEPGEWAVSGGRLYLWMPDGQSPEGRVWAAPDSSGIDAGNSRNLTVRGINIVAAANGINAVGASDLHVANVQIANMSENGIVNSGGSGLAVDGATIRNARHDAIVIKWGGGNEDIRNSSIDGSGTADTIGMPTNARAAIDLPSSSGAVVSNNTITNSGYIAIRVFRNGTVAQNRIDGACQVLTDCGGIYTWAPDLLPLNTVIRDNTISHVGGNQKLAWAIDLDNGANAVTLSGNTVSGNANGVQINNGFNNAITGNRFSASAQAHIQMNEDAASAQVRNNTVTGNSFSIANAEQAYRLGSTLGSASVAQFGSYDQNSYLSSSSIFANFNGAALNFAQWQAQTGQDTNSSYGAP